ncbi:hypothetical protein EYF80_055697 [Liparis tanakae]|uniref:Uncharacterized protein n=1 Tax=Liparis tanakae TaxID=230148 RepID=A0A4Z2EZL7_9TELE|nr:hypothetical protein EYF80_055697 [Liparis tanakae]
MACTSLHAAHCPPPFCLCTPLCRNSCTAAARLHGEEAVLALNSAAAAAGRDGEAREAKLGEITPMFLSTLIRTVIISFIYHGITHH